MVTIPTTMMCKLIMLPEGLGILADKEQQILIILEQERTLPWSNRPGHVSPGHVQFTPMIELIREVNLKLGDVAFVLTLVT